MIFEESDFDIDCPGCDTPITIENAGGYRCFCEKCVSAMPSIPNGGLGYNIIGKYPDFKWEVSENESD